MEAAEVDNGIEWQYMENITKPTCVYNVKYPLNACQSTVVDGDLWIWNLWENNKKNRIYLKEIKAFLR